MTEETGASSLSSKRRSRWVTMPTTFLPTTTGTPEMPRERVSSSTSRMRHVGRDRDRVLDDAAFEFLHPADFARLRLDGHALVDDADAAFLGDGDGEARLGDRVHGGRQQRHIEPDPARDAGGEIDLAWQNFRVGRNQEDIVEGESFFEDSHAQLYAPRAVSVNLVIRCAYAR